MAQIDIKELMDTCGVRFGTSGARGLVSDMTDLVCMAYTAAFLQHQQETTPDHDRVLLVGGDRRPSTPRIMRAVAAAAQAQGYEVRSAGLIPSPALALWGMKIGASTVMVTGSHIPDDRNGMKFTTPHGEITKVDEAGILKQVVDQLPAVDVEGMLESPKELPKANGAAEDLYLERFVSAFGTDALEGERIGVYGHSAVGRDLLVRLYERLGAEVVRLGWSETFIPVDTEAIRPEDDVLAANWANEHELSAIVSTDGDSDRPLCSDERGIWFRGDVTGILTAQYLGADAVALPVSCNTALELSGQFSKTRRTRIGSPFVIEALEALQREGFTKVVGYEANGGFFNQTELTVETPKKKGQLPPLPTRDPVIVHLGMLMMAKKHGCKLSELARLLPCRVTASGRDQSFEKERSTALLSRLEAMEPTHLAETLELGPIQNKNTIDGLRITFDSGEIIHLRPSGNAPELRCYAEAKTTARAVELVTHGLKLAKNLAESSD